ncbi:MAG: HAMP domain-containing histidine kinase [Erysipelotrichaceae bacterium]|nr:HAMP domain-containing histidine kinase [Erysipelotrichaceae bacterium]
MKKTFSFRTQMILTLILSALLIVGLIYAFQTFFLDDFYQKHKLTEIIETGDYIAESIADDDDDDLERRIRERSMNNEVCVYVFSTDEDIATAGNRNMCALGMLRYDQTAEILETTVENGGSYIFKDYRIGRGDQEKFYIYSRMVEDDDEASFVLVSAMITPLGATIATLHDQLWVIALIVLVITVLLGLISSYRFVSPIRKLQEEASRLPSGNYSGDIRSSSTEIMELNETLKQANEEIRKVDTARKELLSNVSHDLRTPLTMIVGYAEMMKDLKEENNEENLDVIITEAKRLNSLVDDLLDVSRIEGNRLVLQKEDVSLNEFLADIYRQYEKYCEAQEIDFKLELAEDGIVSLDRKRISQVLYNFLNNALNYNDAENKVIRLSSGKEGGTYTVSVYDNGPGIKEKDLKNIWNRYYKVEEDHKRHHIGSGIGLSLARDLLELHGLEYGVDSVYGEYSRFWFRIPETQ